MTYSPSAFLAELPRSIRSIILSDIATANRAELQLDEVELEEVLNDALNSRLSDLAHVAPRVAELSLPA